MFWLVSELAWSRVLSKDRVDDPLRQRGARVVLMGGLCLAYLLTWVVLRQVMQ